MLRDIFFILLIIISVFSELWKEIKEFSAGLIVRFRETLAILTKDLDEEANHDQKKEERAQLLREIEELKKKLEENEKAHHLEILEMNEVIKKQKEELELVRFQFKQSETDLEYELEDIVNHLIREEKQKRAEAKDRWEEEQFDKLEEDDFESDCVMVSLPED